MSVNDTVCKSWFCVFNNPSLHGYSDEPVEVCEKLKEEWIEGHPTRTGAWAFCVSESGLRHVHMVLEDTKAMRFSSIKKTYAKGAHFEPTKGTKEQAEDYISKKGKWQEKGEVILYSTKHGEIKGAQGSRHDLSVIEDLVNLGYTPNQIFDLNIAFRRFEKLVKDAYFAKRSKDTPFIRDVVVYWHVGKSGSGKSFVANQLINEHGEDALYFVTNYENGCFDNYIGQRILFLDEFRGQFKYSSLLVMLDHYKSPIHARYSNVLALWDEVHITSVKSPDMVYENLISSEDRSIDTFEQLKRRINFIIYHWKDDAGYHSYTLPMTEYIDYKDLECKALGSLSLSFIDVDDFELGIFDDERTDCI